MASERDGPDVVLVTS